MNNCNLLMFQYISNFKYRSVKTLLLKLGLELPNLVKKFQTVLKI